MFVDACAIVSMMAGDDNADAYEAVLLDATAPFTSTLAAWEAIIVLARPDQLDCPYIAAENAVIEWLEARTIRLREPGSPRRVLSYAVAVAEAHRTGQHRINALSCFHYAYARTMRAPLLTLDPVLRKTGAKALP